MFSSTQGISHITIYEAIQEETSHLQADNPDIHPIPWKSLLIIPRGIQGLPDNWDSSRLYRKGQATNKIKYNNAGTSVALVATWEQFATWGTKGFQNPLQKALSSSTHNVKLKADVAINFNEKGQIVPEIPWWNNERAAEKGKNQIGERTGGVYKKLKTNGNYFVSQVGFAWQYKIPQHSRSTIENTPWELAIDKNGDPYRAFNLPKSTSLYAVRLVFIKADGSVTPLSNIITGSDVQRKMRHIIERRKGTYDVFNAADPAGRRGNPLFYTQVSVGDRKRLTRKARALLNVTAASSVGELQKQIDTVKLELNAKEIVVQGKDVDVEVADSIVNFLKGKIATAKEQIEQAGGTVPNLVGVVLTLAPAAPNLATVELTFNNDNIAAGYTAGNPVDVFEQASLYLSQRAEPLLSNALKERGYSIDAYNYVLGKLETLEHEQNSFLAGGTDRDNAVDIITTIHAPGLESKDRDINQVISFMKRPFFYKKQTEERANQTALTNGDPLPYDRPGYWDPWRQDLPDEACLLMEPWLSKFVYEDLEAKCDAHMLRASVLSTTGDSDVDGDGSPIGFDDWLNGQKQFSNAFQSVGVARKPTTAETRLAEFYTNKTTANLSKSIQYARQRNLVDKINKQQEEEEARFKREERLLQERIIRLKSKQQNFDLNKEQTVINENPALQQLETNLNTKKQSLQQIQKTADDLEGKLTVEEQKRDILDVKKTQLGGVLDPQSALELQNVQKEIQNITAQIQQVDNQLKQEQADLKALQTQFISDIQTATSAKEQQLQQDITDANTQAQRIEEQFKKKISNLEAYEQQQAFLADRRIKLLEEIAKKNIAELETAVLNGNIDITATNELKSNLNDVIAPADIKNGGGYFWKQSTGIDIIPYGQYIAYDQYALQGDRAKLLWTSVNSDTPPKNDETKLKLFELSATSDNRLVEVRARNIQPVLNDRVIVYGRDTGDVVISENLIKCRRSNTANKRDKSLLYQGITVADTTQRSINGRTLQEYVLNTYELLPKPGTYVEFLYEPKFDTEGGKNQIDILRNRLIKVPNLPLKQPNTLEYGAVLSGRIRTIRLANRKTLTSVDTLGTLKQQVATARTALNTAENSIPIDITDIQAKKKALENAEKKLNTTIESNGKFLYAEWLKQGNTKFKDGFESVAVADIEVMPGVVFENVLLADISDVSLFSNDPVSSFVVGSTTEDGIVYGEVSPYTSYNDDTIDVLRNGDIIKNVKKEDLSPVLRAGTEVLYLYQGEIVTGNIVSFDERGLNYNIQLPSGGTVNVAMRNVVRAKINTDATKAESNSFVKNLQKPSVYSEGLKQAQHVSNFHRVNSDELKDYVTLHMNNKNTANINLMRVNPVLIAGANYQGFTTTPDILFRAEALTTDLSMTHLEGDLSDVATLDKLLRLRNEGKSLTAKQFPIRSVAIDVVAVSDASQRFDIDGVIIPSVTLTIRVSEVDRVRGGYSDLYVNISVEDLDTIKVPHIVAKAGINDSYIKTSTSAISNLKPTTEPVVALEKSIEKLSFESVPRTVEVSHLLTSSKKSEPLSFAISTASEGESEVGIITEDEEEGKEEGYNTSWSKPIEQEIAMWATSSSSDEAANTSKERLTPVAFWASNTSSSDEAEAMGGWASSTSETGGGFASTSDSKSSQLGGFASTTSSDDDMDNLHAIISKIDRESAGEAAWVEESDNEGD